MPSPEDKIAAKALVKLGLIPQEEIGEFLEAVDEIEPEGGLLGLLLEDGRITEKDRARVEKAIAGAKAAAGKPASLGKAAAGGAAKPAEKAAGKDGDAEGEGEGGGEKEEEKGKGKEAAPRAQAGGRKEREAARARPSSRRRDKEAPAEGDAKPKGKRKVLLLAGAAAGLLAVGAVVLVLILGSGGGGDKSSSFTSGGGSGKGGEKAGKASGSSGNASPSSPSAGGGPASAPAEPTMPPMDLRYGFRDGLRIIYSVRAETKDSTPNRDFTATAEVNEFIDCMGSAGKNQKVCVERQKAESMQRGKNPPERQSRNHFVFVVMEPEGTPATERAGGAEDLLWVLGDLVFPPGGRIAGGAWKLEREAKEGRFDVKYRIEKSADPAPESDGVPCVRIGVKASFPGGAPPSAMRLDRCEGTVWFDPAQGVVVHAKAWIDTSPANAPAGAPAVKATLVRALRTRIEIEARERKDIQTAADLWFGVLDMVGQRQYAKALKGVEAADLSAKYFPILPDLRATIPEVRMTLLAGAAMRERKSGEFQNLPWRRLDRPPAMLMEEPPRMEGKRRPLPLKDKPAPEWLSASVEKGKATVVYFAMAHIPCCAFATRKIAELAKANRGSMAFKCILLESEARKTWEYAWECGGPGTLYHPVTHDPKMAAITEGKIPGVPAIFVVDGGGTVRYAEAGYFGDVTKKELEEAIGKVK